MVDSFRQFGIPSRGEAESGEGPTLVAVKEIAVGDARVSGRGGAAGSAQHDLIDHEFAVILANRPRFCLESGIGRIGAFGPLPDIAEHPLWSFGVGLAGGNGAQVSRRHLIGACTGPMGDVEMPGCGLPFGFRWEALSGPGGIGRRLKEADMADWRVVIERAETLKRELGPAAVLIRPPVERCPPALFVNQCPAVRMPKFGTLVATVLDVFEKFPIGHAARRELEIAQYYVMRRLLVVEGEMAVLAVADVVNAAASSFLR